MVASRREAAEAKAQLAAAEEQRAREAAEATVQLAEAERLRAAAEQQVAQASGDAGAVSSLGLEAIEQLEAQAHAGMARLYERRCSLQRARDADLRRQQEQIWGTVQSRQRRRGGERSPGEGRGRRARRRSSCSRRSPRLRW